MPREGGRDTEREGQSGRPGETEIGSESQAGRR